MAAERQALSDRNAMAQRTARERAHMRNRTTEWGADEDKDFMQRATVAMVHE
jgi:hypothetical protein